MQLHQVDRGRQTGAVPNSSNYCFVSKCPWYCERRCCLASVLASSPHTDSTRKGFKILCREPPPMCLPCVYLI